MQSSYTKYIELLCQVKTGPFLLSELLLRPLWRFITENKSYDTHQVKIITNLTFQQCSLGLCGPYQAMSLVFRLYSKESFNLQLGQFEIA